MKGRLHLVILCLIVFCNNIKAQTKNPYTYQELSHSFYAKQIDSLKKTWVCPVLYKDKTTQKKYKEIWDERTSFITDAMQDQHFVYEADIYDYVYQIISDLAKANPKLLPVKPLLLLDRSSSVNAYAIGGNIIAVNLGLVLFSETREEIALVIAHELSHNILNHADNSMKQKAEWLTSDDYKKSLNAVLDSKYERLTRLEKVFEGYSFNRSKHSRYHESDADSLGIVLLKNAHISFDPNVFLRLDSSDIQYKQTLKEPLQNYFAKYNLPFEESWTQKRTKGLSTRNFNFKDTTGIDDSLKTHPDCKERYLKTLSQGDVPGTRTPIPSYVKEKVNKMIIWNMFNNLYLTACLYRILLEKDKGNTDDWYDFMVYNIFSGLFYADKKLDRFNAIDVTPKEFISKDYYQLQNMLEQMPRESLEQYCKILNNAGFWQNLPSDAKALKSFIYSLDFDADNSDKIITAAAKDYSSSYATSMYCEFIDHFKKK